MYGYSAQFPLDKMTPSKTAEARGLSNQPTDPIHKANLSKLSDFLGKLPFEFRLNSAYRSPEVNAAVGGAKKSAHMEGLAADISPTEMSNLQAATFLYDNAELYPELDQIIWYTDTSHLHVAIEGKRRGEFMKGSKEGGSYFPWAPTTPGLMRMTAKAAANRPLMIAAWTAIAGLGTAAIFWAIRYRMRK
jgi:zinc D-Ala-D-Ala carboxypeptidase